MALAERLPVKRRSGSRSSSQSSVETEPNSCDRLSSKSNPCQSPMSLAQIISSTYKHSPNLLIPHPALLKLLKTVGAKGERFVRDSEIYTVQQLCFYLKEYIKQRQLYDVNDVKVVYCRGDPLGDVFHVDRFTVYDALDLISKTSTPLLLSPSKNKISISSDSKSGDPQKVKQGGAWKFLDDGAGAAADCIEKPVGGESSPKRSASSVNLSKLFCRYGARSNELPCNFVTSTTDSVRGAGIKRSLEEEPDVEQQLPEKRLCTDKVSVEVQEDSFDSEARLMEREALEQQLLPRVQDNSTILGDVSDVESIYSIQSKETAFVKDSSDDLWFLKDDDDVEDDTDDYSEIYADEYDIMSDISHGSSSEADDDDFDDNDIFTEREGVICGGSETEFADGELSEEEMISLFSNAIERTSSWQCIKCCHRNRAPGRLCDECLNLRTEELNRGEASSASENCKSERPLLTLPVSDDCPSSPVMTINLVPDHRFLPKHCRSKADFCAKESTSESVDSSPQFTSSQESGFFSADLEDFATSPTSSRFSLAVKTTEVARTEVARPEVERTEVARPEVERTEVARTEVERTDFARTEVARTEVERDVTELHESRTQNGRAGQASSALSLCIICLSEPKVASLIHGTSGHQACCYQCALQLKRMHKPCPVCRRPIQKVIRNYDV